MKDRTIYIHIGFHKTGTTALQSFFSLNREKLIEEGIYYPGNRDSHIREADALRFEESNLVQKLFLDLQASESPNFLLSSEGFDGHLKNAARLKAYIDQYLPKINIKIITYIRRQDSFMQSSYQQRVKGQKSRYDKPFDVYLVEREIDFNERLEPWASAFGDENIILRPYEKEQYNNNLFGDFLTVLSLEYSDEYKLPSLDKSNQAFHRDILETLILMKPFVGLHYYKVLLPFFIKVNTKHYEKDKISFFTSNAQRKTFLEQYEESNAILARKFLQREDGILFYDELTPDLDKIKPYKLTSKKIGHVMSLLEKEIQVDDFQNEKKIEKEVLLAFVMQTAKVIKVKFETGKNTAIVTDSKTIDIILHIGDGKTGTSLIQNFLDVNREKLAHESGILYPNLSSKTGVFEKGRHHNHAAFFNQFSEKQALFSKVIAYCQKKGYSTVILSDESLFKNSHVKTLYSEKIQFLHKMREDENVELKVICYLRRIDDWLESAWKQWGLRQYDSIEEYIDIVEGNMRRRTFESSKVWEDLVGTENFIIQPYEKQQLKEGLIANFFERLNLPYNEKKMLAAEKTNDGQNTGFSRDVLELLHFSRPLYKDATDNRLLDIFYNLLGVEFHKKPFENYNFLSPSQRLELLAPYEAFYEDLAQRVLGRTDGKFFYEPYPASDEAFEPYDGLTLEKIIPIFVQMIMKQQDQIRNLNRRVGMQERKHAQLILDIKENSPIEVKTKINVGSEKEREKEKTKKSLMTFFVVIQNIIKTKNIKYFLTLPTLFDEDWYLEANPEVRESKADPYIHYLRYGWREMRNPNPYFNVAYYFKHSPEIKEKGIDPLYHYINYGWREGKNPSPKFNIKEYLEKNPSVVQSGEEPLLHFLKTGGVSNSQTDGRT